MAVINGNDVGLSVGSTLIGCLTGATFSSSNEVITVTCKDNDGARATLPGGNSATISFNGFFNPSSTYGLNELMEIHTEKTEINWHYGDNTNLTLHGAGTLDELSWEGPLNAGSTFSGTITVTGTWTYSET